MRNEIKKSYAVYTAWNYEKEEAVLDRESEAGWQLLEGGVFHNVFRKDPTIYRYKLDYNPSILKEYEEKERYIEIFKEQGWEFINSTFNGWHYFRKPYKEGTPSSDYEIYTDQASYYEMLSRWLRLSTGVQIGIYIMSIVYLILGICLKEPHFLVFVGIFIAVIAFLRNGSRQMKEKCNTSRHSC